MNTFVSLSFNSVMSKLCSVRKRSTVITTLTENVYINLQILVSKCSEYCLWLRDGLLGIADRILSIAWYEPENVIITGGVDCIRVWSVNSGQAVMRLDTGRVAGQVQTYVYALAVTEYVVIADLITAIILLAFGPVWVVGVLE